MFEKAARAKLRFASTRGLLSVEELWDLSLEALDSIFKALNAELKTVTEESLLTTRTKEDSEVADKLEIVKHIFQTKQAEKLDRATRAERRQKRARLQELLVEKQDKELSEKSSDELQRLIDELAD